MLSEKKKETQQEELEAQEHLESLKKCDQESERENVHGDFQEIANKAIVRHRKALIALSQ